MTAQGKTPVIFCDFDGTITNNDNIVAIMKHFKPEGYEGIMKDTIERTISIREGVGRMFALFPSSMKEEITSFVLEHAGIREGFGAFLEYLKQESIEFFVTSGGIDFFVDPILKPYGIPADHIFCNGSNFEGDTIEITWPHPCKDSCTNDCGMCKVTVMDRFPADQYYRILIGDSLTDFEGAKQADLVYSRSTLTEQCRKLGVHHVPFETFTDIYADLNDKLKQGVL
ncbi:MULTISPECIES: 2-hydroxy-3-keto-5-methylthiopentenyl-1-phosphate phosphatase [Paenibacillus]|uniref:2-hydroxy-3-keto-5-methylthiopentenyl-1-phosphate phosphatase n=2 Tax=Paenibacillus lactis TaxID=228574 RepID=G4HFF0_9BACL|nr:2-hydroxy-3-keto-5-methylthiopentenyl-1-phosphate phosphatase [Paenibacillus lactis]EHB64467.1 2,3-diketo-5-methylthio-1-phosphopentane phosphatase [Paenibacillus lactis 154]MBP1892836.1 2-hydroxy-3-keto-5-methylthiopentenyl-1-phosphate phosphatase [Paenibacillus lactis]MCM3495148.1 2-hydroxy-3-keto-5-methylthiopentenyl-1-phosphate phosphatase [Paenibacillus lactis]GIO91777.1 2-hydroxy-3-keto-5-methylthiopentenyl-1-phosphate phosphatase [Paenibacillus lactis]HAF97687.1 2-hydroxy-3-keto-5-me